MLLVEDVGEVPLFEAALHGDGGDLYRLAADELLVLHLDGTRQIHDRCIASQVAYDERLFRWELSQFVDYGIGEVSTTAQADAIAPELDDLAARLGRYPRVLSHRDYHGHNLFLQAVANGVTLNLLGLVALSGVCRGKARGFSAMLLLSALPIAILATMTRAVWLSFAGSVAWLGLYRRGILRKASIALFALAALGLLVTLATPKSEGALLDRAGEQEPIDFRMAVYRTAWEMAGEKPVLGWGLNQMPTEIARRVEGYRAVAYAAHNSFLEILVENGAVGLALYLSVAVGLFRLGRKRDVDPAWRETLAGEQFRRLWPVLVGVYWFNACFVVMNYQFVNAIVFTLAGVLAAQQPTSRRRRDAVASAY